MGASSGGGGTARGGGRGFFGSVGAAASRGLRNIRARGGRMLTRLRGAFRR